MGIRKKIIESKIFDKIDSYCIFRQFFSKIGRRFWAPNAQFMKILAKYSKDLLTKNAFFVNFSTKFRLRRRCAQLGVAGGACPHVGLEALLALTPNNMDFGGKIFGQSPENLATEAPF